MAMAQEKRLEAELLIFEEVPIVITAAKYEQPITEAPATISVVTAEDIKQSGSRDIQEALRNLPGIEVMVSKASQIDVGVRGDNASLYNRLLVMVDGRSVYQDFYGMTEWPFLEIGLEEIKRIEVIRGPGSALYGANAFTGVVNIITKTPEEMKGNRVVSGIGNYHSRYFDMYNGNGAEDWSYKASTGWREINRWQNQDEDSLDVARFNSVVEHKLDEDSKIILSSGISSGEREIFIGGGGGGTYDSDANVSHLKAEYRKPDMYLRIFWNRTKFDAKRQDNSEVRLNAFSNVYDAEFQKSFLFDLWKSHRITWGASHRYNTIDSEQIDRSHRFDISAGYINDELKLSEKLLLNAGIRVDHYPLTDYHTSPRGSIIYLPKEGHLLRLSAGTSFRTPSFAELYTNTALGALLVRGNSQLSAEQIVSYDLGYEFPLSKRVKAKANLFYNAMDKLIGTKLTGLTYNYLNNGERNTKGAETELDFLITEHLKGFINHTVQDMRDEVNGGKYRGAPKNKINSGLRFASDKGLSINTTVHYVDDYELEQGKIQSYILGNARIGYMFPRKDLELGLSIYNLFHKVHREYPAVGDELGTLVTLSIDYKF
jgi:iron complex outermembrane receptor protein